MHYTQISLTRDRVDKYNTISSYKYIDIRVMRIYVILIT